MSAAPGRPKQARTEAREGGGHTSPGNLSASILVRLLLRPANAYLVKTWVRARSALNRKGITPCGFRISEPQHDGTPHWHVLLFCLPDQMGELQATLKWLLLMGNLRGLL